MGWPTKGSGKAYNSHTGFGHMVGVYSKKVLFSKILCGLCHICDNAKKSNKKAKKHDCIKNWDGSSKRMEAQAILDMCISCPYNRNFVAHWIISDDDSSMRAVLRHAKLFLNSGKKDPEDKGLLPTHIIEPEFKADPSHRNKVVAKYFYKLKKLSVKKSRMTGDIAKRLKRSWGYMLKQNRGGTIEEFVDAAKSVLNHTFDDHRFCKDWCQALKAAKEGLVYNNPRGWLSRDTKEGELLYQQIEEITSKYGSIFYLLQSMHQFDTQTNEALNQSQACLTPKAKVFHSSRSFHYRHAITVGCHNWGFDIFWKKLFDDLGITYSNLFMTFVEKIKWKRSYWKSYHERFDVKRKRAYKQNELEKKQMYEKYAQDKDYGSGVGLDIGFAKASKKRKRTKRTQCKCGSTTHLTSNSKQCPLNKKNLKIAKSSIKEKSPVHKVCVQASKIDSTSSIGVTNAML